MIIRYQRCVAMCSFRIFNVAYDIVPCIYVHDVYSKFRSLSDHITMLGNTISLSNKFRKQFEKNKTILQNANIFTKRKQF